MLAFSACKKEVVPPAFDAEEIIEQKVDSLLALMTLEEKIGQMTQIRHFWDIDNDSIVRTKLIGSVIHTDGGNPGKTARDWQLRFDTLQKEALKTRLGIPLLFGVDAVHGQNTFNGATIFPHNIGFGAAGDVELVRKAAEITAIESRATGFNWVFAPCAAIPFNERWGRVYEAFSEDVELTTAMTQAAIEGLQSDLSNKTSVLATAKHFIGDGATDYGREGGETSLAPDLVNKYLLPPYEAAIEENVSAVMASFNKLYGQEMHAYKAYITDTLKGKMDFDGIVMTDWKGYSRFGRNDVVNAGVDMFMAVDGDMDVFQTGVLRGVKTDTIAQSRIDDAVKRILKQKFRLGLFEQPFSDSTLVKTVGSKPHRDIAREAVRKSLVLMKNSDVLPIKKDARKIVVVGEHADNTGLQSGGWTIRWQGVEESYSGSTSILEGIKQLAGGEVVYDARGELIIEEADLAIVVVGEKPYAEFFGDIDHEVKKFDYTLSRKHKQYIKKYQEKGIPVITILISGRPLVVTEDIENSDAFVCAWLPGSEGDGVAQVLFGDYDFTGKLPHSWPKSVNDYDGLYGPNYWDKSIEPLFSLGYGLDYKTIDP
jgi:beta-glucosidase